MTFFENEDKNITEDLNVWVNIIGTIWEGKIL